MEIAVAEQGLFLSPIKVTQDQAKEKAWEQKLSVFGTLSKFLLGKPPSISERTDASANEFLCLHGADREGRPERH